MHISTTFCYPQSLVLKAYLFQGLVLLHTTQNTRETHSGIQRADGEAREGVV